MDKVAFKVRCTAIAMAHIMAVGLLCGELAEARSGRFPDRAASAGVVSWVSDGDTVWVKMRSDSAPVKVRITGIDAPEICQPGGAAARAALAAKIMGQEVTLTVPASRRYDSYGRVLARMQWRGEDVGGWMVRNGQAWSYRYRNSPGPYRAEQAEAQAHQRGLFKQPGAENPRDFRRRHGTCHLPQSRGGPS